MELRAGEVGARVGRMLGGETVELCEREIVETDRAELFGACERRFVVGGERAVAYGDRGEVGDGTT